MKQFILNIFWILFIAFVFMMVFKRIEDTNRRCVVGIEKIESILKSGEVIEYESN